MNRAAIRAELLHGSSRSIRRRRAIAALAAAGAADSAVIALHQVGVIRRLPDLPGRIFDANRVTSSPVAYETGFPDAAAGAAFYGLVMTLASAKGDRASGRGKLLDSALAGAALAGAGAIGRYLYAMLFKERRLCIYCLIATAINAGILALSAADWIDAISSPSSGARHPRP